MRTLRNAISASALLIVAGCSGTPYQPMGITGGYKDAHIKDNIYFVEVTTNAWTSETTAAQYFHRRAKEVCLENGYGDYRIQGERDTSTEYAMASHGSGGTMNKPGFAGYVECIK